jgi:hypothetical protein
VVGARAERSRESALCGLRADLVGRDAELTLLGDVHRDAAFGVRAVLLLAPPGVGKSRLVTELCQRTLAAGGTVWRASVSSEHGRYGAVAQLLREAVGPLLSSPDPARLLLDRLGTATPRARLSVEHTLALVSGERLDADPAELRTSWKAMLDAHSCGEPPIWVIEDIHRAPADLRAFLHDAITDAHGARRMIVLTARPSALAPLGEDLLDVVRVVDLAPLDRLSRTTLTGGDGPAEVIAADDDSTLVLFALGRLPAEAVHGCTSTAHRFKTWFPGP